ncbi:MAG: radical SAM protein [Thermodesulfobacteriota bacterium]
MDKTAKIWLCDLTHTYQTVAINRIPLGLGMVGSYCREKLGEIVEVHLFKFLDKLVKALEEEGPPLVCGFANYVWNQALNLEVARRIKGRSGRTAIVFGGPNFPAEAELRLAFLQRHPWVDFYIPYEGEQGFAGLVQKFIEQPGEIEAVKNDPPANTAFVRQGRLIMTPGLPRIEINEVPSPYLTGLLDEFFGELKPLVQLARGCPFSCTYCTEGLPHWNKVVRRSSDQVYLELRYIAERCQASEDLFIADSNFGMYAKDLDHCRVIARLQDEFQWPKYIHVATGKNRKERILEAADILRGALRLSASVQSTDKTVLSNVKRKNISVAEILNIGLSSAKTGANTYSEVILGLPGDSLAAHFQSLRDVLDAGLNVVRPYTLMLLPGTELASRPSREEYRMLARHRLLPRCFGRYEWLDGEAFVCAEIEEVCVGNATLGFEDYLRCRSFHFTLEIFFNDGIFSDIYRLLAEYGVSAFDFLLRVHETARKSELGDLYNEFIRETREELWDSPEKLRAFMAGPGVIEKYQRGECGANLLFKYKTLALTSYLEPLVERAFGQAESFIFEKESWRERRPWLADLLGQLKRFHLCQRRDFLDTGKVLEEEFDFDLVGYTAGAITLDEAAKSGQRVQFAHEADQREVIRFNLDLFGDDLVGLSRLISQVYVKKCYRTPKIMKRWPGKAA